MNRCQFPSAISPPGVDDLTSGIVEQLQSLPDRPQAEVGLLEIEKVLLVEKADLEEYGPFEHESRAP